MTPCSSEATPTGAHADIVQNAEEDKVRRLRTEYDIARIAQRVDQQVQQLIAAGCHDNLIYRKILAGQSIAIVFKKIGPRTASRNGKKPAGVPYCNAAWACRTSFIPVDRLARFVDRQRNLVDKTGRQRNQFGMRKSALHRALIGWLAAAAARLLKESTDVIKVVSGTKTAGCKRGTYEGSGEGSIWVRDGCWRPQVRMDTNLAWHVR